MDAASALLTPPAELETWLILIYVLGVLAGARVFEALARLHFQRARRYAERGFVYDADGDHYECPQGERLALFGYDPSRRLALYRAPAARCNGCPMKEMCTPHDEGRHLYRPLAAWAETDLGRFHQRLSLLMFGVGAVLSAAGLVRWGGRPGTGLLVLALAASVVFFVWDVRAIYAHRPSEPTA